MAPIRNIRQLFCKHNWEEIKREPMHKLVVTIHGDMTTSTRKEYLNDYVVYRCNKCLLIQSTRE
ncbi:hypothetical protein LCGC14_1907910 [marine sediment metagenome]|uniref:Uncharacterized protein n=1 Tax=marine sediment metagenome TaxID=412755 RepID=A0A0F9GHS9_9ZZZZ